MVKVKTQYICQNCGYNSPRYLGRCPNCGQWNTLVEERVETVNAQSTTRHSSTLTGIVAKPQRVKDIDAQKLPRVKTKLNELNRVLGGGIVPGSLILIGGDPGIGKSTLLLQVSGQLSDEGHSVLYVSGEESGAQIKMRAERLAVAGDDFYIYPETSMDSIRATIDDLNPEYVVIDSVQTMQATDVNSAIGSVSQIREVTAQLMQIAKSKNITIFVVGHVTKGGALAGPKILEHMVDTVLYFEGDLHHTYRILRAVKNRFGSTNELGIFEMRTAGLAEVKNPSEIFLEERLQDLVTPTVFGNAQRTATGLNRNRVSLIMAVLEKRANLMLQNQDAYLKAAGGVKLDEPAIDLAIAIAIASSYRDKGTRPDDAFVGEVGLTGEIRRVSRIEQRVAEAAKLGFKRILVPKNNLQGWNPPADIEVVGVTTINEALRLALA